MPNGRFWIGKSTSGALADSTQLRASGSCVSSSGMGRRCYTNISYFVRNLSVMLREAVPDAVVILLQLAQAERVLRRAEDVARLPHERERVIDLVRLEIGGGGFLARREVRALRRHAVVDGDAARQEAFGLGVVDAVHQSHQLAHHVAVEPRWPEGALGHQPARREDDEVAVGDARRA